jgi:hypothetical protein
MIPGVRYRDDFWLQRCRKAWEYYRAHPDGPYVYNNWDPVPPRVEARPTHARWLARYRELVEEGTWAWLEIGESNLLTAPPGNEIVVSAFANRHLHLVVANFSQAAAEIATADDYMAADSTAPPQKTWQIPPRSLAILRRAG